MIELAAASGWKASYSNGRERYRPTAPVLRERGSAAGKIPPRLLPLAKKDTSVYAGPRGSFFLFTGMPAASVRQWSPKPGKARALDVPPVPWPYHHDFTEDGRYLFLGYGTGIRRLDLESGDSVDVATGLAGTVGGLAVAGGRVAVVMSERLVFASVEGAAPPVWFPWKFGNFVGSAARRIVVAGSQRGSLVFGVDGLRVVELAGFPRKWVSGFREVKGALRVSAQEVDDRPFASSNLRPLEPFLLRGALESWEALLGSAGEGGSAAKVEARVTRARGEGRIAWVPARPLPEAPPPAGVDLSALTYVAMGPAGHGRGCTPYPHNDMHWYIHAVGPQGVAPVAPELACLRTSWSFHFREPRALVANFDELVEVDLQARRWRKLAKVDDVRAVAAYFGDGAAAMTDRELVIFGRKGSKLVPAQKIPLPGKTYEERALATLAGGRALMVRQGQRVFVLGGRDGQLAVLGAAAVPDAPPTGGAFVGGRDILFRGAAAAVEVHNLDAALEKARFSPTITLDIPPAGMEALAILIVEVVD